MFLLGHRGNKALGKFNAGYLSVQLFTEDLRSIDDADAVRQDKRRMVDNAHEFSSWRQRSTISGFGVTT